jgi:MFS family permease
MDRKDTLWTRDFTALWTGQVISQLGSQAAHVATALWIVEVTGSTRLTGLVLALSATPVVLLGPLGGALADRYSRKWLIIAADSVRGIAMLVVAALLPIASTDVVLAVFAAAALLNGTMTAGFLPALTSILPSVVPATRLASANALSQSSAQVSGLVGLAFGGVAYLRWGAPTLLAVDGLSFLVAAAATAIVRDPSRGAAASTGGDRFRENVQGLGEGWRWVRAQQGLPALLVALGAANLLFMPVYVLLPLYVRDRLHAGSEWYGLLLAAASAGALAGLASVGWWRPRTATSRPLLVAGLATTALSFMGTAPVAAMLLAIVGAASSRFNVVVVTAIQASTPERLRGRIMAFVVTLASAAAPLGLLIGSAAGGLSADLLPLAIGICGAGMSAAAAWSLRVDSLTAFAREDLIK